MRNLFFSVVDYPHLQERIPTMPILLKSPTIITAAGNKPKKIEEFIGRVNSKTEALSIARMKSPQGWEEPGQTPQFDEYTVVLKGVLRVQSKTETVDVAAGQAVIVRSGEWVRYSTPGKDGAEYIAVCLPAFAAGMVNRDGGSSPAPEAA
jgi:mannose-6-phosphate isomerase-like protein (cupin superfamily)